MPSLLTAAWSIPTSYLWLLTVILAFGYLLGSIPFGLLITKAAGLGDVRAIGSGNIGATNVLRTGHKGLAAATLILDALKGTAAVVAANQLFPLGGAAGLVAGFGAFVGHLYPVWLGFKGGKGVATYIGVALGVYWPLALVFCGVWLAVAALLRYSSLAALLASILTPLAAFFAFRLVETAVLLGVMTVMVLFRHHANIRRLVRGEEPKIGAEA